MADAVIDLLERVDVDEEHPEVKARESVARNRAGQLVGEDLAIWQRRQRIARRRGVRAGATRSRPWRRRTSSRRARCRSKAASASCRRCDGDARAAPESRSASRWRRVALRDSEAGSWGCRQSSSDCPRSSAGAQPSTRAQASLTATKRACAVEDREHAAGVVEELLEGLEAEIGACADRRRRRRLGAVGDQPERQVGRAYWRWARSTPFDARWSSSAQTPANLSCSLGWVESFGSSPYVRCG